MRVFILYWGEVARVEGGSQEEGRISGIGVRDVKFTKNQ